MVLKVFSNQFKWILKIIILVIFSKFFKYNSQKQKIIDSWYTFILTYYQFPLARWLRSTVVCALYVHYTPSECMESCLTPRSSRASPPYLPVSSTAIKSESVTTDVDAHLALLTEAVGCETIYAGPDQTN